MARPQRKETFDDYITVPDSLHIGRKNLVTEQSLYHQPPPVALVVADWSLTVRNYCLFHTLLQLRNRLFPQVE